MKDDLNKYTILLKKILEIIAINIIDENHVVVDHLYASFNKYTNKYYLYKSLIDINTLEILVYHNIIEQINQESVPEFVLTQSSLISLL